MLQASCRVYIIILSFCDQERMQLGAFPDKWWSEYDVSASGIRLLSYNNTASSSMVYVFVWHWMGQQGSKATVPL
jgi:hypothetical protein